MRGLVGTQLAISTMLLIVAVLFSESLLRLGAVDPGFDAEGLVALEYSLPASRYGSTTAVTDHFSGLLDAVARAPGVTGASLASTVPMGEETDLRLAYAPPGEEIDGEAPPMARYRRVGPGFFELLGVEVLEGRPLVEDDAVGAPGVAVLSRSLAQRAFPDGPAVGRTLAITAGSFGGRSAILVDEVEVVGVVEDTRYLDPAVAPEPTLYLSHAQAPFPDIHLLVRTASGGASPVAAVLAVSRELDPALPPPTVRSVRTLRSETMARDRFIVVVLGVFSGTALLLAWVGVFSVVASSVQGRATEMAVRQALGARPHTVVREITSETLGLVVGGVAAGVTGAAAASGLLTRMLFEVSPTDPTTYVLIAGAMVAVGVVSGLGPARRAIRADPAATLRSG